VISAGTIEHIVKMLVIISRAHKPLSH